MVGTLVSHLQKKGFSHIRADHLPGFVKPEFLCWDKQHQGFIPDVVATKGGQEHIFEVETEDSFLTDRAGSQYRLFSVNAQIHGKTFSILVPRHCKADLETYLHALDIENAVILTLSIGH